MKPFKSLFNFIFFINLAFVILFIFSMSIYGLTQYTFKITFWKISESFTIRFTSAQFIALALIIATIIIGASVNVVSSGINDKGVSVLALTIIYFIIMSLFLVITSQYFNTLPFLNNFMSLITVFTFGIDFLFRIGGLYNE